MVVWSLVGYFIGFTVVTAVLVLMLVWKALSHVAGRVAVWLRGRGARARRRLVWRRAWEVFAREHEREFLGPQYAWPVDVSRVPARRGGRSRGAR